MVRFQLAFVSALIERIQYQLRSHRLSLFVGRYVNLNPSMKAFLLDHDDSFTFNLRDWLKPVFADITVVNHRDSREILTAKYDLLVLSPGPKTPQDYPHVIESLSSLPDFQPVLGICLGLQTLVTLNGGTVQTYTPPLHGKTSSLETLRPELESFQNSKVARYHSLICGGYEKNFDTLAYSSEDGHPMWLLHKTKKQMGFQFHPESFMTENSDRYRQYLRQWLQS